VTGSPFVEEERMSEAQVNQILDQLDEGGWTNASESEILQELAYQMHSAASQPIYLAKREENWLEKAKQLVEEVWKNIQLQQLLANAETNDKMKDALIDLIFTILPTLIATIVGPGIPAQVTTVITAFVVLIIVNRAEAGN
jgi:hypothetical protein